MTTEPLEPQTLSMEEANALVIEHQSWAESVARAVARAWNLDWQMDGLDGAAMEALIYCSRRFKPDMGVPFRGYARKRIHEAASEAAKKTKGWRKVKEEKTSQDRSREISAELVNIFPELREGRLPETGDSNDSNEQRSSIRQMLVGASLLAARQESEAPLPDQILDYKRMIILLASLEPVHQLLMYRVYWDGLSLRSLAEEWNTDGLNVIREHKIIVEYLYKELGVGKQFLNRPKVRPGLRDKASELRQNSSKGPFTDHFGTEGK
jgi:DNA-directed RNA polymerase specialized sigma subunit